MGISDITAGSFSRATSLLGSDPEADAALRHAAWVARCVGRGDLVPLRPGDVDALAARIQARSYDFAERIFTGGEASAGVWIVKSGRVELTVGSGKRRVVVQILRGGDVDGDVQHFLGHPMPYSAHALEDATLLFLEVRDFEDLLSQHPAVARRWLQTVAQRVATSQDRIIGLLGCGLVEQVARMLIDEAVDGVVELPQKTLAAMLGVQRQSLNRVLKKFERAGFVRVRYSAVDILNMHGLAAAVTA
ncbi:Crp/Fnr family transcriptional regulator [Hoyosella sp. YIM 151337]|uniref:Crp/Fnr family transcriptional regulator n=1 Tax=Hoyosella sp. YIM 151337 TaxID=2992742 RepID=UPI002235742F|nr:Crp/Fnr family transcriptional regulator [Hoyosella sp. YIM 151337]MCW4355860.1 Crp/Fnr family transcriptional regulator [Hoyosella sp. YIM 151337]